MEEHFSAVFAVLLLGTGLAQSYEMTRKKEVANQWDPGYST